MGWGDKLELTHAQLSSTLPPPTSSIKYFRSHNANTNYTSSGQNILNSKTDANYSEAGATRTVGGQGKAHAILYSTKPNSKLTLEIIVIYNVVGGGGYGDAKTNDGRTYKVIIE